jgi:hypothetical protein
MLELGPAVVCFYFISMPVLNAFPTSCLEISIIVVFVNKGNDTLLSEMVAILCVYCNGFVVIIHMLILEVIHCFVFLPSVPH